MQKGGCMKDLRLTNQINYLLGKKLEYKKLKLTSNNDHGHCSFCWKKFYNGDFCYIDEDSNNIVCSECYSDFKEMFKWR